MVKQTAAKKEKEDKARQSKLDALNKKHRSNIFCLEADRDDIPRVSSGLEAYDEMALGWPRGRIIELFGPEGSGKTYMCSMVYSFCAANGLKALHYDAEGTYSKKFAKLHGVDLNKLHYSQEESCEKIFGEIESFCESDVYDVICIDSLAALVPERMMKGDVGDEKVSPLALALGRCIPRMNKALKKSKTVLIIINQLRDAVGTYGTPEKTPGGRIVKFFASVRVDVRKVSTKMSERPDMFDGTGAPIGHILKIRTVKDKTTEPFKECRIDLWYRKNRKIIELIKNACESDIIERQRSSKTGELRGKKLKYKDEVFTPDVKNDYEAVFKWLKEKQFICPLLEKVGEDDFDQYIESEDLTKEEVETFLAGTVSAE